MPLSDTDRIFRPHPIAAPEHRQQALIVDDCRLDQQILTRAVRMTGLDIDFVAATSCDAAQALLDTHAPFALAFVDRILPDGCGIALTGAVAARNVPTFLVSGDTDPALEDEAKSAGCIAAIPKDSLSGLAITRALTNGLEAQAALLSAMPDDPFVAPHLHLLHQLVRDLRRCPDARLGHEMTNMIDQLLAAIEASDLPVTLAADPARPI